MAFSTRLSLKTAENEKRIVNERQLNAMGGYLLSDSIAVPHADNEAHKNPTNTFDHDIAGEG